MLSPRLGTYYVLKQRNKPTSALLVVVASASIARCNALPFRVCGAWTFRNDSSLNYVIRVREPDSQEFRCSLSTWLLHPQFPMSRWAKSLRLCMPGLLRGRKDMNLLLSEDKCYFYTIHQREKMRTCTHMMAHTQCTHTYTHAHAQ